MRKRLLLAATALSAALSQTAGVAPALADPAAEAEAQLLEGEVIRIDLERSRVTLRSSDGRLHELEASAETLKDLKVGDRIEAKRRAGTSATD